MAKPFLIPGVRPGFQPKQTKKGSPTEWLDFPEKLRRLRTALFYYFFVDFPSRGIGKIKRGVPRSAERGQHTHFIRARRGNKDSGLRAARLDRAGSQARTRFRPLVLFALGARIRIVTYGLWAGMGSALGNYFLPKNRKSAVFCPNAAECRLESAASADDFPLHPAIFW